MFIDLTLCEEHFLDLGFDKALKISLIEFNSRKDLKKKLDAEHGLRVVIGSKNNRNVVEEKKVDLLLSPEKGVKRDSFHHRNSGLDMVVCKLAKKNNIAIGFNFNDVLRSEGVVRAETLGRMIQNVRLCRKHKLRMVLGSFARTKWQMRSKSDLLSFGIVIGMHPAEAMESLQTVSEIGHERKHRWLMVSEGVEIIDKI
ncbi:hypothetical protein FJZ53_03035 [Candidatus Woesearchaeota archaeon]|nr:hypothetical protein [Candidatus Woesearchaeota archaeon]